MYKYIIISFLRNLFFIFSFIFELVPYVSMRCPLCDELGIQEMFWIQVKQSISSSTFLWPSASICQQLNSQLQIGQDRLERVNRK